MLLMLGGRFSGGINALMNSIGPPHHSSDALMTTFVLFGTWLGSSASPLQTTSKLKHLPRLERHKLLARNLGLVERGI